MISFDARLFSDLDSALGKEWVEANGLGGYCSSTVLGLNTRRYHALLVAATRPPRGRMVMLSKLEETLVIQGVEYELSCNEYPGVIHPRGHEFLREFRLGPFPTFSYEAGGACLEKTIFMPREKNAVVVRYGLVRAPGQVELRLRPLIACRDHHYLCHENSAIDPVAAVTGDEVVLTPYGGAPSLFLRLGQAAFSPAPDWYRRFRYREEFARGLDYEEDLFCPGILSCRLSPGESWDVVASIDSTSSIDVATEWMSEVARRQDLLAPFPDAPEHIRQLHLAADSFIVKGQEGTRAVIAGYHWFGDWGRDTMIALPGLTLAANRLSDARDILSFHLEQMSRGLIPNFLPERGESPAYNSIDATLWLFVAAYEYFRRSNDLPFLRDSLYPALVQSITWHVNGTDHGIVVDRDGLLMGGDETTQLTWMDATTDGCPVTPRQGKPVEVNALWYNACRIMQEFAHILHCEGEGKRFGSLARKAKASFQKAFWNPDKGCLFDCVGEGKSDSSVRPNQVFALSLPFPLLAGPKATSLMKVVERELLIPFGLRSLSPEDGRYIGRYAGDQRHRDGAYHQGTAWAWLLGPFLAAYLRVHRGGRARHRAAEILASFSEHLSDAGLGTISENFDGDPPHTPCGCISQAWSVATVLDAYWRFVSPSLAAGG